MIRKPELSTSVYCSCAELTVVKDIAARDALKVKDKQRVLVLDAAGDKIKGHAEYIYYLGDWYAITATVAGGGNTTIEKTGMTIIHNEDDLATIPLPIDGDQAYALEGGIAYVYAGEWLELSRQGAKGDALKFEDLTEEQKEELKGPPGDKGERGEQGDPGAPGESSKVYIFDRKSELALLEDMVEGEHAYIKDDEMEYIFVDGEWKPIGSGGSADSILAEKVITNNAMQFITREQKALIKTNKEEIDKLKKIVEGIDVNPPSDGKVKLNEADTLTFLVDKFGPTIILENGKLNTKTLLGQLVEIEDINQLAGIKDNVQKQIDALSRVGNFTGSVETKAALLALEAPTTNDMVIVLEDESQDGESTIYMHNGNDWVFAGKFSIKLRDFTTEPINLITESKGTLPKGRIELPVAADIIVEDAIEYYKAPKNAESVLRQVAEKLGLLEEFKKMTEEKAEAAQEVLQVKKRRDLPKEGKENCIYVIDEDETNENKTSVYVWIVDPLTNKGAYNVIISASVSGKMQEYQQVTKMGVTAPRVYEMPIPRTQNFLRAPIEVLMFEKGKQNIKVDTKYSNHSANDFEDNDDFLFDNKGFSLSDTHTHQFVKDDANISSPKIHIDERVRFLTLENLLSSSADESWNHPDFTVSDDGYGFFKTTVPHHGARLKSPVTKRGKYYWEVEITVKAGYGTRTAVGIADSDTPNHGTTYYHENTGIRTFDGWEVSTPRKTLYGSGSDKLTKGEVVSVLLDLDNEKLSFWVNGVNRGVAFSGSEVSKNKVWYPYITGWEESGGIFNLGQKDFKYNKPDGYQTLYQELGKLLIEYNDKKVTLSNNELIDVSGESDISNVGFYSTEWNNDKETMTSLLKGKTINFISDVEINNDNIQRVDVRFIPDKALLLANGDFALKTVDNIDFFKVDFSRVGEADIKLITSVDEGETWKSYDGSSWIDIEPNVDEVGLYGIPVEQFNNIPSDKWNDLRKYSNKIRFGYYLKHNEPLDVAKIHALNAQFDMTGEWFSANKGTDYKYSYPDNSTIKVTILKNGDYKINY